MNSPRKVLHSDSDTDSENETAEIFTNFVKSLSNRKPKQYHRIGPCNSSQLTKSSKREVRPSASQQFLSHETPPHNETVLTSKSVALGTLNFNVVKLNCDCFGFP